MSDKPITDALKEAASGRDDQPGQGGQALILQTQARAVEQQPLIDFGTSLAKESKLVPVQNGLNDVLNRAKASSKEYLKEIQPAMIGTLVRIDRYVNLQLSLSKIVTPDASKDTVVRNLKIIEEKTRSFQTEANDVALRLSTMREKLAEQVRDYSRFNETLATITKGDTGLIASLNGEMDDIDGKIHGLIAATVVSGLAVIGGGFLIAVGSIAGFVTAGTSVPLAVFGGVVLAGGVAGTVGSSIALAALVKQKSDLLMQKTSLENEVVFAQGLQSTLGGLKTGAEGAASAAQGMANAWNILGEHLKNLADDVADGRMDLDALDLFLGAAELDAQNVRGDVRRIQDNLRGVPLIAPDQATLQEAMQLGTANTLRLAA
ncbi:MAG TPA: HBL/NHE enterotoxin family protein [Allosphingosinicella sp.]